MALDFCLSNSGEAVFCHPHHGTAILLYPDDTLHHAMSYSSIAPVRGYISRHATFFDVDASSSLGRQGKTPLHNAVDASSLPDEVKKPGSQGKTPPYVAVDPSPQPVVVKEPGSQGKTSLHIEVDAPPQPVVVTKPVQPSPVKVQNPLPEENAKLSPEAENLMKNDDGNPKLKAEKLVQMEQTREEHELNQAAIKDQNMEQEVQHEAQILGSGRSKLRRDTMEKAQEEVINQKIEEETEPQEFRREQHMFKKKQKAYKLIGDGQIRPKDVQGDARFRLDIN